MMFVFISEVFPNAVRAKGQALGTFVHWVDGGARSRGRFPVVAKHSVAGAFGFFAAMMVVAILLRLEDHARDQGRRFGRYRETFTSKHAMMTAFRREHDLLGVREVPAEALWGIHTLRAAGEFPAGRPAGAPRPGPCLRRGQAGRRADQPRAGPVGRADVRRHRARLPAK